MGVMTMISSLKGAKLDLFSKAESLEPQHSFTVRKKKKVTLNVSGLRFETYESTLEKFPNTLLGSQKKRTPFYNSTNREYCFPRDNTAFDFILFFYQSDGMLVKPVEEFVPDEIFRREVAFFELGEAAEAQLPVTYNEEFDLDQAKYTSMQNTAQRVKFILKHPGKTIQGKILGVWFLFVMALSIVVRSMKTLPIFQQIHSINYCDGNSTFPSTFGPQNKYYKYIWLFFEVICSASFTLEYFARLFTATGKPCHNGQSVLSNEVHICAKDIQKLDILENPPEVSSKNKEIGGLTHNQLLLDASQTKVETSSPGKPGRAKKSSTYPGDRSTTPKKNQEGKTKSLKARNKECFGQNMDAIKTPDFDFEKNLAKFDKKAVFEELENSGALTGIRKGFKESNLKHTDSVLEHEPVIQRQICVPSEHRGKEFLTDAGIAVPAVSLELRNLIFETSERMGLTREQRIECAGMCAFQMAMQVLGGSQRFSNNLNQSPSVVVMAGPHLQGLNGICAARHLANKNMQVTLFIPRKTQELIPQLALYMHTGATLAASVRDFPNLPVDLVIDALSDHEKNKPVLEQTLSAIEWSNDNKAPVLSIDPCEHSTSLGLEVKWSLALGLPLMGTPKAGRLYLGDVGIPKGVFSAAGVTYVSPFRDKIVIPLDD